jgi:MscS family membrane protein
MNKFLQQVFFGNTVQDYLISAGIILLALLLNKIASRYVAHLLCKLLKRQWKAFDEQTFVTLVVNPLSFFITVTIAIIALYRLNFPPQINITIYKFTLQQVVEAIGIVIQIVTFIWLLLRMIDFIATVLERRAALTADQNDNQLIVFFKDFVKVAVGIVGFLMVLHFAFNYNVGTLLTGLSIVGAAIALALRESLENLIASFVIFFDKPFTTGDFVKVQSVSGSVERIGLRSTRIRTAEKSYVTVPNKQMVDSILDNVSLRSQMRAEVNLHIHLQTTPAKIEALLTELKGHLATVREIQSYSVLFNEIRLQSFVVWVEFFTLPIDNAQFQSIKQGLNLFALQTMEKLEIHMAAEGQGIAITP